MINQVTLVGRLTKEPELKWTTEDRAVLNLTIALNRFGKNKRVDNDADFIQCVIWGKRAEATAEFCSKGQLVGVIGELQSRQYLNKEEQKVYITEVLVHQIRYLSSRSKGENVVNISHEEDE
ncbi:TPA_asm: single-stranded DNA-binding protein [Listeria innocua]|uniref:single-stranded DNA-binding protein n=1 Tax=Listeria innocua TaxID=1642 RepID=UPI0001EBA2D5|nr:single-stranded DNA-binding protein [Listeria innocua]OET38335.1 single-stranded DNA-binding protein [Listeria monocytogenes]QPQ94950.1 single-stranded DNA-binding protein [Listeria welshimeri]EAD5687866.1 single-stranded DNA-binding protein [Listeria innocua]EAD5841686.1 single-stranded DNA-binding protein [Listeria innocua]EAF5658660.1 single-stranded DNA-binding protein [Listeria innocua]